ncbi:hypothetical protein LUW77_11140 [Streptomyces radiopugnans]|nr:hypothetical protein LUW77_11140 [Streptomyces radiopugnans]
METPCGLGQVDELVRLGLDDLGDVRHLDALDVGEAAVAGEAGEQLRVVVLVPLDDGLLDLDLRVELLVLLVETGLLEAEGPEEADGDDGLALAVGSPGLVARVLVARASGEQALHRWPRRP